MKLHDYYERTTDRMEAWKDHAFELGYAPCKELVDAAQPHLKAGGRICDIGCQAGHGQHQGERNIMKATDHSRRINAFRSEWASGIWQSQIKPDMRLEWARHFNALGLGLHDFRGRDVLEIGCGATGAVYYLPPGRRRIGVDPAAPSFEEWNISDNTGRTKIELLNAEAESLNFDSHSFDAIFCINVLDHTSNPEAILAEIRRTLRPGGMLVLHYDIDSPLRKLHKRLHPHVALLHPHSLSYKWTERHILRNASWKVMRTHRDPFEYVDRRWLYETFWDNLIWRASGLKTFINHLWIFATSR